MSSYGGGDSPRQTDRQLAQQIAKILSRPDLFPDEFKSWLPYWLGDRPELQLTKIQLPKIDQLKFVGITNGAPVFTGTWVDLAGGYQNVGYWLDIGGTVHLCGSCKSGTAGTEIFPLPPGYRPQARVGFAVPTNTGYGVVEITNTGSVVHISGGTTVVELDGISFRQYT